MPTAQDDARHASRADKGSNRVGKSRVVRAWTVGMASLLLAGVIWVPTVSATAGAAAPDLDATTLAAALQPTPPPAASVLAAPSDTGAWGPILDWGQQAKHMAMLSTGKVLVWSTGDNARVWDPTNGTFKLTPFTFGDLHCAGQSTLADGRVVVVGGQNVQTHAGTNITALFDPATETWVNGASMHDLRWYATSTTLADGKVLATSGDAPDGSRSTDPRGLQPDHEHVGAADDRPTLAGPLPVHVRPAQRPRVRGGLRDRDGLPRSFGHWPLDPRADRALRDERLLGVRRPVPARQDPSGRRWRSVHQEGDGHRHERREPGLARDRLDGVRPPSDEPDAPGRRQRDGDRWHRFG